MVKAICKVSHLVMDDATYRRGDMLTLSPEKAEQLGTSIEILAPSSETVPIKEKEPKPEPKPPIEKLVEGVKLNEKILKRK